MGIAFDKKTGNYDYWYTNPRTGKRTKKRILRADKSKPKDEKEAERLIQEFRRGIEELDSIKTRERAVLEVAQARQLIASKTHRISDLLAMFEQSPKFPQSESRRKYARVVISKFVNWCKSNDVEAITDATEEKCQSYIDKDFEDYAGDTIKKHIVILSMAFAVAGKKIGLAGNPWKEVKRPVIVNISRKDFSLEQVETICGNFESWFTDKNEEQYIPPENDQLYVCYLLGVYAGCRLKDACLMQWSQIDFEHGTITYTPQKTSHSSGKEVTLPILEGREKDWLKKAQEWQDESGYVCPKVAQMYLTNKNHISQIYIKCFELATGVKNRYDGATGVARSLYGFHSLRATCASILVNAGVDINIIAEILGHRSALMTMVYAHLSAQRQAEELKRAFGKGAQTRQEINKILDGMSEKQLKSVLQYLKYM